MRIRIKQGAGVLKDAVGREFDVQSVSESASGEKIYFVHYLGTYLSIHASECEIISPGA
jgi:hypothetical protein